MLLSAATGTKTALASGNFPNVSKGHEYTVLALPGTAAPDIGLIDDPFDKGLLSNSARARLQRIGKRAESRPVSRAGGQHQHQHRVADPGGRRVQERRAGKRPDSIYVSGGQYVLIARRPAGSKTPIYQVAIVHAVGQRRLAHYVGADRRCAKLTSSFATLIAAERISSEIGS